MKCGNLASHPMIRGLLDLIVPFISDEKKAKQLSYADSYNLEIFDATGALIQSFELLERSQNFVMFIPSAKYLKGLNMNRHEWLEYHISTFLITFVTVRDEALQLVNGVFCLGIDPKHCRPAIVKDNKWIKDTTIPKNIKAIERLIETHRKMRNLLVHGGKAPSLNVLCKSENLDQLKTFSFAVQHKPEEFSNEFRTKLDEAYIRALMQINKALENEVCQLKTAVWQLLTDLHKFYSERLSILSGSGVSEKPAS